MNSTDILIIYLASGAPFGVYYYLNNRAQTDTRTLWFKSLVNFLFWLPLAFSILRCQMNFAGYFNRFRSISAGGDVPEDDVTIIQKKIEAIYVESRLEISVYEFREILERYTGLTLADVSVVKTAAEYEKEFYRISRTGSVELGAICLNRRNRKRLSVHQTAARGDFLQLINRMGQSGIEREELKRLSNALTEAMQDFEARRKIAQMFDGSLQIEHRAHVKKLEKDIWKPAARNSPTVRSNPHLHSVNRAQISLRTKD